jgi:amino acid transporter
MIKKVQYLLLVMISIFNIFFIFNNALAATNTLSGLDKTANKVDPYKEQVGEDVTEFIQTKTGQIIGIVLAFVGIIFLVLMIYAGVSWMTSGGNQEKVTKAKNLIVHSIIGLILVLAAYATVAFVGNLLTQ